MKTFRDRHEAGLILAKQLEGRHDLQNAIVLALPRGGVPVAFEIATELALPLDVFIVRKLGVPGYEELAVGAIASGGTYFLNKALMKQLNLNTYELDAVIQKEQKELARRELVYRSGRPFPEIHGKKVILVDDGIATGASMRAAVQALKEHKPESIIVAVPVAAYSSCQEIAGLVDEFLCPLRPIDFHAVGLWYDQFPQTTDEEVIELLSNVLD